VRIVSALIERALRHAMHQRDIPNLAVYPEDRTCTAPTTARIIDLFEHLARHHLTTPDGTVLRTFAPELTDSNTRSSTCSTSPPPSTPPQAWGLKALREVRNAR
jgi:hypothetical protein